MIYVVHNAKEDWGRDITQCYNRDVAVLLVAFTKWVLYQGLKVITSHAEKCLQHNLASFALERACIQPLKTGHC